MDKTNELKKLFNFMKKLGLHQKYETYEDFRKDKFGTEKETLEDFKNTLDPEDKNKFEQMFED